jgi:PIN domain nuclease of toxin-antitoxin system
VTRAAILLDTCAVIWLGQDAEIAPSARVALQEAWERGEAVYVSPITAWELGLLVARGRLMLAQPPAVWFERFLATPGLKLASLLPRVLAAASFLPGAPPNDPADRILSATARDEGYRLMTRDGLLLRYASAGHLQTIAC